MSCFSALSLVSRALKMDRSYSTVAILSNNSRTFSSAHSQKHHKLFITCFGTCCPIFCLHLLSKLLSLFIGNHVLQRDIRDQQRTAVRMYRSWVPQGIRQTRSRSPSWPPLSILLYLRSLLDHPNRTRQWLPWLHENMPWIHSEIALVQLYPNWNISDINAFMYMCNVNSRFKILNCLYTKSTPIVAWKEAHQADNQVLLPCSPRWIHFRSNVERDKSFQLNDCPLR